MAISDRVKKRLWASSGGYCQNPACNRDFFMVFENGDVSSVEELAHIIARSGEGPRGDADLALRDRDIFENIILLCPTCHTTVDKNSDHYPVKLIRGWKHEHEAAINHLFIVPTFDSRAKLGVEVHTLLQSNRAVFNEYGPWSKHVDQPITDAAREWQRLVLAVILPNNKRLLALLRKNKQLLNDSERDVVEQFAVHQEGFEYNHLSGNKSAVAPVFPREMNQILAE